MSASKSKRTEKLPPWTISSLLAVAFPLGILPKAPGTFGSLAGIPLAFAVIQTSAQFDQFALLAAITALTLFGIFSFWIIKQTEEYWQTHDDGRIVIDEVLGQAIVLTFVPFDLIHIIAGFVLFRLFDIWKPWLVGYADQKLPGAWGTLLDDVIAGIFALIALLLLSEVFRNTL